MFHKITSYDKLSAMFFQVLQVKAVCIPLCLVTDRDFADIGAGSKCETMITRVRGVQRFCTGEEYAISS